VCCLRFVIPTPKKRTKIPSGRWVTAGLEFLYTSPGIWRHVVWFLPLVSCFRGSTSLGLFFDPEYGDEIFFRNVGWLSVHYIAEDSVLDVGDCYNWDVVLCAQKSRAMIIDTKRPEGASPSPQNPAMIMTHCPFRLRAEDCASFETPYAFPFLRWLPLHSRSCGNYTITLRAPFSLWSSLISGSQTVVRSPVQDSTKLVKKHKH
jgi:hypothetical protein